MGDRRFETSDVSEALPIRDKRSKILIENQITTSAFGTVQRNETGRRWKVLCLFASAFAAGLINRSKGMPWQKLEIRKNSPANSSRGVQLNRKS